MYVPFSCMILSLSDIGVLKMISDHVKKLPIFWGHGTADPLVKLEIATRSGTYPYARFVFAVAETQYVYPVDYLKNQLGVSDAGKAELPAKPVGLSFNTYPGMQHTSCEEELSALAKWFAKVVPATS